MDHFAIYTYGHIDAAFHTLNAIAMVTGSPFMDQVINAFTIIGVAYGVILAAFESSMNRGAPRAHLLKIFKIIIIINLLFTPKASMVIVDHVSKQYAHVSNLPIGFVLPISMIEAIGDRFSRKMEQAFSMPHGDRLNANRFNYINYGPIFGASLIQEVKNVRFQNPTFAHNMENFLDRCVLTTAAIGIDFTFDEILNSSNIWEGVIKRKMKDGIREVVMINPEGGKIQMGCKSAAKMLESAFGFEFDLAENIYRFTNFGQAGAGNFRTRSFVNPSMKSFFEKNLGDVFKNYFGLNQKGSQTLYQLMLMNAFSKYGDYGTIRAMQNQETGWKITGLLGTYYLPMQLTIMKCLLYGMFIFVLPSMILSGSFRQFASYLTFVASFQLWPALFAILNMFIDMYSADTFTKMETSAVSLSTFSQVGSVADKIVGVASILQLSIPFISFQIIKGSYETFSQMSSYIQSSITSAAASSAAEVISGNRSFDNVSIGNTSGFKTDLNTSYAAGASSYQNMDGSISKITSGGELRFFTGDSKSRSESKFTLKSLSESQISDAIRNQSGFLSNLSKNYSHAQARATDTAAEMFQSISDHVSRGHSNALLDQITSSKEYAEISAKAHDLHVNHGMSKDEAWRKAVKGYAGLNVNSDSLPIYILKKAFGVSIGGGIEGSLEASGTSGSHSGKSQNDSSSLTQNVSEHKGISSNQTQEQTLMHQLGVTKDQINRFNESMNETHSLQQQMHVEQNKLRSLESGLHKIQSYGGSFEQDISDKVITTTATKLGKSEQEVINGLHSYDLKISRTARRVFQEMQDDYNKELGLNISIPTHKSFENQSQKDFDTQSKKAEDIYSVNAKNIETFSADAKYQELMEEKTNSGNTFNSNQNIQATNTEANEQDLKNELSIKENAINNNKNNKQSQNEKSRNNSLGSRYARRHRF